MLRQKGLCIVFVSRSPRCRFMVTSFISRLLLWPELASIRNGSRVSSGAAGRTARTTEERTGAVRTDKSEQYALALRMFLPLLRRGMRRQRSL